MEEVHLYRNNMESEHTVACMEMIFPNQTSLVDLLRRSKMPPGWTGSSSQTDLLQKKLSGLN